MLEFLRVKLQLGSANGRIVRAPQNPGTLRLLDSRSSGILDDGTLYDPGVIAANVLDDVASLVDLEGVAPLRGGINDNGGSRPDLTKLDVPPPLLEMEDVSLRFQVYLRDR